MKVGLSPASILQATVDDILGNPGAAVRISMPIILAIALMILVVVVAVAASDNPGSLDTAFVLPFLIAGVAILVGFIWTAVAWHRHVILGEPVRGLLPRWPSGHLLGYFGRSILVSLVVFVVLLVPLIVAAQIAPTPSSPGDTSRSYELFGFPPDFSPLSLAVWAVLSAISWGVSLRAGLILPACAIGEPRTLGEVWNATKGRFFTFFAPLGLIIAVLFAVLDLTTSLFSFGGVTQLFAAWLQVLIGIGVLTQLHLGFFGHSLPSSAAQDTQTD